MTYHFGPLMNGATTNSAYAIFVGPSWNNPTFTSDKVAAVESFFSGFGQSGYAKLVTEYFVSSDFNFSGSYYDYSDPPDATDRSGLGNYVCGFISSHGLQLVSTVFYAVYSTQGLIDGGNTIGYHAQTTCGGIPIRFGVHLNVDNMDLVTDGVQWTSNAAALVNTTAHELTEALTDPDVADGWFASNGLGEIGDKCNFSFGTSPYVTLSNGAAFKVQGLWSNSANDGRLGFANANGEPGCVKDDRDRVLVSISGSSTMSGGQMCRYYANTSGGAPPYSYSWTWTQTNGGSVVGWSESNGEFTLVAESTSGNVDLHVTATDATGKYMNNTKGIVISSAQPCFQ
jgi:hypothetical protein